MPTWKVMACTDEEYAKADADHTYSPKEHLVGRLTAENEAIARNALRREIRYSMYPAGSQLVEDDGTEGPVDTLARKVRQALREYDKTGDHTHHLPSETDCVRCRLKAALGPWSMEPIHTTVER